MEMFHSPVKVILYICQQQWKIYCHNMLCNVSLETTLKFVWNFYEVKFCNTIAIAPFCGHLNPLSITFLDMTQTDHYVSIKLYSTTDEVSIN